MKRSVLVVMIMLSFTLSKAQDVHFSHFFSMPIFQNPAFTGYMDGDVRVAADFRMQWETFGNGFGNAFRTAAVSADFGLLRNQMGGSTLGVGATFINDAAGDLALKTNQAGLAVSYVIALDQNKSNYLGVGFHGSFSQRSIDFTNAQFPDQVETDLLENYNYFNLAAGLLWFYQPTDDVNFYLGGALFNIFQPNVSFFAGENIELDRRYTAQFGSRFNVSNRVSFVPSILFQKQGPSQELIFGTFFKYKFGNQFKTSEAINFQLGAFYRFADAIIPVVRLDYKPVSFVFSYDVNLSKLTAASKGEGGAEISITYTGRIFPESNKYKSIKCPIL
ncbi:MAG: PorP/SprF family type IX secretion system membrane protein [Bacteroidetes bacterium]|nr:PorP/SprF family type IX secretion system membrane protein [Bacteroidota bacterium]